MQAIPAVKRKVYTLDHCLRRRRLVPAKPPPAADANRLILCLATAAASVPLSFIADADHAHFRVYADF